jgi:peptidoglycan/xylan/chitin deacetylase (PgdA/CDA1 family)
LTRQFKNQPWRKSLEEIQSAFALIHAQVPASFLSNFAAMLGTDQLRVLAESPLVEIGGHTHSHPYLSAIADDDLAEEIDAPTRRLSEITGRPLRFFAYPLGCYGPREAAYVEQAGFRCAFAVTPQNCGRPRFEVPRVGIYDRSTSVLRVKSLGLSRLLRSFGVNSG